MVPPSLIHPFDKDMTPPANLKVEITEMVTESNVGSTETTDTAVWVTNI